MGALAVTRGRPELSDLREAAEAVFQVCASDVRAVVWSERTWPPAVFSPPHWARLANLPAGPEGDYIRWDLWSGAGPSCRMGRPW
jgi:hypothetical protein